MLKSLNSKLFAFPKYHESLEGKDFELFLVGMK